jgi:signal transduction histidine kinase
METPKVLTPEDKRLNEILEMISAMAALDFSKRLAIKLDPASPLEAVAYGVNMLSEELQNNVIERRRLEDINKHLEEFAYTTSHDLKSPLHSVLGLVTLLQDELKDTGNENEDIGRLLEMISGSVNKMREMIDGILEYSRLENESYPGTWIEPGAELNDLIQMHTKHTVRIILDNDLPKIWFNRVVFIQIMDNLINNAIKYCNRDACEIHIGYTTDGHSHQFSVSDNGPGIAPEFHDRIFQLFVSLPHSDHIESSGIGLATVKKLVENAGGTIHLDSTPGKGATFRFRIPIYSGK